MPGRCASAASRWRFPRAERGYVPSLCSARHSARISAKSFLSAVTSAQVMGALLHFKFLSDFHDRVETEVARGEHFDGAREYRAYRDLMRKEGAVNLMAAKSARYEDSGQLVRLGLMRTTEGWERFAPTAQSGAARPSIAGHG